MKLRGHLNQPRRSCTDDAPEVRVVDFAIHRRRAIELRVVEEIERFGANVYRREFRDPNRLAELYLEVLNPGAVEEAPGRIAQLSQRVWSEEAGIERRLTVARVCRGPKLICGVSSKSLFTSLPSVPGRDRSESSNKVTGNPVAKCLVPERLHPFRQAVAAKELVEGQCIGVGRDEVVSHVA
jgi:hypothetical protein